ncbi:hypothetical protein Anas_06897 [Armadillidium nasatum]|uniref:BED-type domain-containing protein n=1 Tax=Armadillidium nasatum TaxID=96803 RepID=A0A5N5TIR9_9CRUS|nr:hypothetical protein Anas_06897 [Armadillidium nasatum]
MKTEEGENVKEERETPIKKKVYAHKFQDKWLRDKRFSPWLTQCKDNDRDAFCSICHRKIAGSVTMIERHKRTKKHINRCIKAGILQVKIDGKSSSFVETSEKKNEISDDEMAHFLQVNDKEVVNTSVEDVDQHYSDSLSSPSANGLDRQGNVIIKDRHVDCMHLFQQLASSLQQEDEFDLFAKSIASQLRKLPEDSAISLIAEFQNLVTQKRLRHLNERHTQHHSIPAPQVITVSYENPHFNT